MRVLPILHVCKSALYAKWTPDLSSYDKILVAFSGGKDSMACVLRLLDLGVSRDKIELHHHDIDGGEAVGGEGAQSETGLMDWPCTRAYCKAVADALGLKILFSWRVGGFEQELRKQNAKLAPVRWESMDPATGLVTIKQAGGERAKTATRMRWPALGADLQTRWCSGTLKIDVMSTMICNEPRFTNKRTLVITGERAEESSNRARYKPFESHRTSRNKRVQRHVDHWRPVLFWDELMVWSIIGQYGVNPHPAYKLGWARVSCAGCIFGNPNQWASLESVLPGQFDKIVNTEQEIGHTIRKGTTIKEFASKGAPYSQMSEQDKQAASSKSWAQPILMGAAWMLPKGAFGEKDGPC